MKLYQQSRTLPAEDYQAFMAEVERAGAKRVLEIGPGYSTFAFIEAGCEKIVCLEHDPKWFEEAKERFNDFPQVEIRKYWNEPEARAELEPDEQFDIALVDSPKGYKAARVIHPGQEDCSRYNTLVLALKHSPVVLLHDASRPLEKGSLGRVQGQGHKVTMVADKGYGLARVERNA
jgi:hypothetical protein